MPETELTEHAASSAPRKRFGRGFARLASGSALFFSGRLLGAALAYVTQVALANWMGDLQFGRYAGAFATCTVVTTICVLGLRDASLRVVGLELANENTGKALGFIRRGRQIVLGGGSAVALIGAASIWGYSHWTDQPPHWALITSFLAIPVFGLLRLQSGHAHAFRRFALTVLPNTIVRPAAFLAVVAVLWFNDFALGAGLAMAVHFGVALIVLGGQSAILARVLRPQLGGISAEYDTRSWLRISSPLLVVALASTFDPEVNVTLLGLFRPPEDVAIYWAAWRTAFFIGFGIIAIDSLVLPSISQLHAAGDVGQVRHLVAQAAMLRFCGGLVGLAALALWGRPLLAFFGEEFERGYRVLLILGTAQLVRAGFGPVSELLNVTGRQVASMWVSAAGLALTAILFLVLVPAYGLVGASVTVVIVTLLTSLASHEIVRRSLGVHASILGALRRR